jgi:predicted nucleotidyltransferase
MWLNERYEDFADIMYNRGSWLITHRDWPAHEFCVNLVGLYGERVISVLTEIDIHEALGDIYAS